MTEEILRLHKNNNSQRNFIRHLLVPLLLLLSIMTITGCDNNEQVQQQAFIDFLQTRLLATHTVNVPELTADQQKEFGRYIIDYAVMTDFHRKMSNELNSSLVPVFTNMNALTSVNALLEQRNDLQKMAQSSQQWLNELKTLQGQADAQHNALKQSATLKGVYDQAYNKVVIQPSAIAQQIYTLLPRVLNQIVLKADFIKGQGKHVTISGSTLQFSSQAQLDKYTAIQKQLVPLNAQLITLSRQLQEMVN